MRPELQSIVDRIEASLVSERKPIMPKLVWGENVMRRDRKRFFRRGLGWGLAAGSALTIAAFLTFYQFVSEVPIWAP